MTRGKSTPKKTKKNLKAQITLEEKARRAGVAYPLAFRLVSFDLKHGRPNEFHAPSAECLEYLLRVYEAGGVDIESADAVMFVQVGRGTGDER